MPELPEVETMRRDLEREVLGRRIERARVGTRDPRLEGFEVDPSPAAASGQAVREARPSLDSQRGGNESLESPLPQPPSGRVVRIWQARTSDPDRAERLALRLEERRITAVDRRGKYLLLQLDSEDVLMIHLGMTGHLSLRAPDDEVPKHLFLSLLMDDGRELRLSDPRGFGEARALSRAEAEALDRRLGPEPLAAEFSAQYLAQQLARRKALIKPLLLNQTVVAGLGNIYVDESLWGARVHPLRRANTLAEDETVALHRAIVDVIGASIERRGTTFSDFRDLAGDPGLNGQYLWAYHQGTCQRCGTPIETMRVGGRGTSFCPECQRLEAQ